MHPIATCTQYVCHIPLDSCRCHSDTNIVTGMVTGESDQSRCISILLRSPHIISFWLHEVEIADIKQ